MVILLVEDDKFFQHFYSTKLKESGFEVDLAEDGEQGLQKLAARRPDVVLLDLIMPKKDGFDFLQGIKNNPSLGGMPILVFSTLGQPQDIQRAMQMGATGYANKTFFDFDNLLRKIFQLTVK